MKKMLFAVLTVILVLSIGMTAASAAGLRKRQDLTCACREAGTLCLYQDKNGDGICDRCGASACLRSDAAGCGKNFVDLDGDGICDHVGQGLCP